MIYMPLMLAAPDLGCVCVFVFGLKLGRLQLEHVPLKLFRRREVPGSGMMMSRSHLHSFWHDDPADPEAHHLPIYCISYIYLDICL